MHLPEPAEETGNLLTRSGLEVEHVERVESVPGGLEGIVIGEVLTCRKHPEADKLSLTTVDVGAGTALPIVCGAANVAAGQKVVVATVGATLYPTAGEPFRIKRPKSGGSLRRHDLRRRRDRPRHVTRRDHGAGHQPAQRYPGRKIF